MQASPYTLKVNIKFFNLDQHFLLACQSISTHCCMTQRKVEFLELKIRIFPRKLIIHQNLLVCYSGAQVGSIHEKTQQIS